jgi:hypothetical protein
MNEQMLLQVVIMLIGALSIIIWWFFRRIIETLDTIEKDLSSLTIDHGQRITRLEVACDLKANRRFSDEA